MTDKIEKAVTYRIEVDANGVELSRKVATRGRPPKNSAKDKDGNLIVTITDEVAKAKAKADAPKSEMITVDAEGNEISRKAKGRGRPAKGFEKQTDGPFAGHWLKVETVAAVVAPAPAVDVTQAVDATQTA